METYFQFIPYELTQVIFSFVNDTKVIINFLDAIPILRKALTTGYIKSLVKMKFGEIERVVNININNSLESVISSYIRATEIYDEVTEELRNKVYEMNENIKSIYPDMSIGEIDSDIIDEDDTHDELDDFFSYIKFDAFSEDLDAVITREDVKKLHKSDQEDFKNMINQEKIKITLQIYYTGFQIIISDTLEYYTVVFKNVKYDKFFYMYFLALFKGYDIERYP